MAATCYFHQHLIMSNAKKDLFLKVLKETKLPFGYASNIGRCVHVKERNFSGYKTHDAHVVLRHLLQVAVRKTLPKNVAVPLTRLGNFFHGKLKSYVQNTSNSKGSIEEGEHQIWVNSQGQKRRWDGAQSHSLDFIDWFFEKVQREQVNGELFWLAKGPNPKARRYNGYFINGYRFYTRECDSRLKTQNSGVTLTALTSSFASSRDQNLVDGNVTYCGIIEEIFEVDFWSQFSVVLFKCDWFLGDIDEFGLTYVNFKKKCSKDDPFVLAFQEPSDSSSNNMPSFDANHIHVGAGGGEVRAVNIDDLSDSEDVNNLEDDIDFDYADWNCMDATDDIPAHEP
uniref:DUF4216 domain-containing protein n=1 Tax=Chenopodium quinoa TaxID=63459 RepID=A0A803LVL3_CHEQI